MSPLSYPRGPAAAAVLLLALAPAVASGSRPFDAEPASPIAPGAVELEAALTLEHGGARVLFPEETGDAIAAPILGLRAGLGPWGELRLEGEAFRRFDPDDGAAVSGAGDWRFDVKVRFGAADRPPRWAGLLRAKVPVASDADGLGTNLADVEALGILSLPLGRGALDANGGIAILGAPFRERAQVDVLVYAAAYRHPLRPDLEAGIEIAGREAGDFFPARSTARAGLRWRRGGLRLDAALAAGLASGSPDAELRLGATFSLGPGAPRRAGGDPAPVAPPGVAP